MNIIDSDLDELPVRDCFHEIVEAVKHSIPVVLKAPPGAGKTTGVPPALLRSGVVGDGKTLLIQPRRLAARAAASRLARVLGVQLGREVGYHVRFDNRSSKATTLLAMTTGVLLRRLQADPLLEDVSCVLLDEFHERSLEVDLALGMLQRIRTSLRPELKLIVMSATLDGGPIVDFLGDGRSVTSEGRAYPVEIRNAVSLSRESIDQQVASVLPEVLSDTAGHLLVFLPGLGEIRRTAAAIRSVAEQAGCEVLELYGDLPPKQQDSVLAGSDRRKIILSTNVAETSITIDGVTGVIDSGTARVLRFDSQVGLPKLQLEPISQASAEQRAGRGGRTAPGVCYRLWPAAMHRSRRERDTPEIERSDFSASLLTLCAWGERDVDSFPWLTTPPTEAVAAARELLIRLDAIDDENSLTTTGEQMLRLPLHPRLARFMVEAARLDVESDAAMAAAMLSERNPFRGTRGGGHEVVAECDITDRIQKMQAFIDGDTTVVENDSAARQVQRVAGQIERMMETIDRPSGEVDCPQSQRIRRALLAAYPDRVARRRDMNSPRGVMVGGRGVRLHRQSLARSGELFLCIDVDSQGTEATVRAASSIEPEWLDPRLIRDVDEPLFDAKREAVVARRRRYYDDLLLNDVPISVDPTPAVARLLADHAGATTTVLFTENKHIASFVRRVRFLSSNMPELELPRLDDDAIHDVLLALCQTRTKLSELRSAPWLDHLRGRFDYQQSQAIDQHAPARMTVPSGNEIAIEYDEGKPPKMEVRVQELFGWKENPRIAGGKVKVQLHLLGPNYRPQQVTEDLANFWNETYHQVRKDLRRRYPKHHWPEDPTAATATRNGLKPRQ